MSDDDDRANRLRERRQKTRGRAPDEDDTVDSTSEAETANPSEPAEMSKPSKPDETANLSKPDETSVKDEQVGTYMYLPEWQKKELDRVYGLLKAQYEYEFDADFEKNRHFFPLVVRHGLETLDGASAADVDEYLSRLDR